MIDWFYNIKIKINDSDNKFNGKKLFMKNNLLKFS